MAGQLWVYNLALFVWDKKPSHFIRSVVLINIIFGRLIQQRRGVENLSQRLRGPYTSPLWIMHACHKPLMDRQANAACQGE